MKDLTARKGGRRARLKPKGREVEPAALDEVQALIGAGPYRRDLLIEYLHRIQDACGHLSAANMRALADLMALSQAEVYEVATFYAHFDVVKEGETPPPPLTVRVCDSLSCMMAGAHALKDAISAGTDPAAVRVVRAPCMGRCSTAPVCEIGHYSQDHATPGNVLAAIADGRHEPVIPDYPGLDSYLGNGGYEMLKKVRDGEPDLDMITAILDEAGLRGLGGAGFPAGRKWQIVSGQAGPRLMTVNADEGEPGTFKDRYWLERDPHRFFEGALIAAEAVGVDRIYIYLRDEYPALHKILATEIAALESEGLIDPDFIELRRGAGAYICGEKTAMLENLEGKKGMPRLKPPFPAAVGVYG
ncbi:MAG: NAD(P)H-dependent oxidoreductase subunit E, partial [Rhodobiaceae bacterium]|nr:NAD(P)H-dependent oxidoreductase subunit E [Rhodobiaceae bacterium]